jgi:hypothetical protein
MNKVLKNIIIFGLIILAIFLPGTISLDEFVESANDIWVNIDGDTMNGDLTTTNIKITTPVYDDLRFQFSSIRIGGTGATNVPSESIFLGGTKSFVFDPSTMNQGWVQAQFPHSRKENTVLMPHFHWSPTTTNAGDVRWCIEYTCANVDNVFPTTTQKCVTDASDTTLYKHQMSPMIDIFNNFTSSAICNIRIYRNATDTADTYPNDAFLHEFDIHYIVEDFGDTI